jgi:hypothetical protein
MSRHSKEKLFSRMTVAVLATTLTLVPVSPGYSQSTPSTVHGSPSDNDTPASSASNLATNAIVQDINAVRNECAGLEPVYRIDCLRQGLRQVVRRMPTSGDYKDARQILSRTVSQLNSIQGSNIDSASPRKRSRGNARFKAAKTFTAIKRQNLDKAMAQAQAVIQEAETRLLRSSENSQKRSTHYQKIATAIGSTKVLMRSA